MSEQSPLEKRETLYRKVAMSRELGTYGFLDTWCVTATMDVPVSRTRAGSGEISLCYEGAQTIHRRLPKRIAAAVVAQYVFAGASYAEWKDL